MIFQANILLKNKSMSSRGPSWSGGPGAIDPVALPLIRPCWKVTALSCGKLHQVLHLCGVNP